MGLACTLWGPGLVHFAVGSSLHWRSAYSTVALGHVQGAGKRSTRTRAIVPTRHIGAICHRSRDVARAESLVAQLLVAESLVVELLVAELLVARRLLCVACRGVTSSSIAKVLSPKLRGESSTFSHTFVPALKFLSSNA